MKLTKRGARYYLRKTIDGTTREISLGTDQRNAKTKAARFLLTLESNGYESALLELGGKTPIKKGTDPTYEQIKKLYSDFLAQSDKQQVRENTKNVNLNNLKRCIEACGDTLGKINYNKLREKLLPDNPTPAQKRSFGTIIRTSRSIFKTSAIRYYKARGLDIVNPFSQFEIDSPKVETYTPLPQATVESIWNDCDKELAPHDSIIVLLALGCGLRRSEIKAARVTWFSIQSDNVLISVQAESDYTPKSGEKRVIPMDLALWERIQKLRGEDKSERLIPFNVKHKFGMDTNFERVNIWLNSKGIVSRTPIHSLRKQAGSILAKNYGILEASRFLGHAEITTTARSYAGTELKNHVQVIPTVKESTIETLAKEEGISLEALKEFLAKAKRGL